MTDPAPLTDRLSVSRYSAAEAYHQRYVEKHPNQCCCAHVVAPKVAKFRQVFKRFQRET
jgi:peptide-methionine (S)-S-oxide reductase